MSNIEQVKRIVVCCDGTWNDADSPSKDTNVFRIARAIHGDDGVQIVLYLQGVGTTGLKLGDLLEGAIGLGVDEIIRSAYMFIAQNYVPGDEIFLFGFSRGAYTARSLAGFIGACGLLKRQRLDDLPKAWEYYRGPGPHDPGKFMQDYGTDCHTAPVIRFLGVWETVGAMGIPGKAFASADDQLYGFHDTGPCKLVKHGCHAMAVDENRHDFVPTLWTGDAFPDTVIEQVWFAGVHADVGGGYKTRRLADIPLVWMAKKAETDGLRLDWSCLPDPVSLDASSPTHDSCTGVFLLDGFRRTWRQVAGQACHVGPLETIYAPIGRDGRPLRTINEALHESLRGRFGKSAPLCIDDDRGTVADATYEPKNLRPFFDAEGAHVGTAPVTS